MSSVASVDLNNDTSLKEIQEIQELSDDHNREHIDELDELENQTFLTNEIKPPEIKTETYIEKFENTVSYVYNIFTYVLVFIKDSVVEGYYKTKNYVLKKDKRYEGYGIL